MGKEGLRLVLRFFNEEGVPKKDVREAADHCLTNYRFVYKNPDDDTVCFSCLSKNFKLLMVSNLRGTRGLF